MAKDKIQGVRAPTFRVIDARPPSVSIFLLAAFASACILIAITFSLRHAETKSGAQAESRPTPSAGRQANSNTAADEDKDDPSQVDTIYLGDAADAPVPAAAQAGHVGRVHPTVIVRLPRFGPQMGLIPNTDAGHLLYRWLAAFNQANSAALEQALQSKTDAAATVAAQLQLRQQTGGFRLLSAKEVQPGLLVFRLEDQTRANNEALGTLQLAPSSNPAAIASLSLRATNPAQPQ